MSEDPYQSPRVSDPTSLGGVASHGNAAPRLTMGRRASLSAMTFLQYGVWGAWSVVLGVYLEKTLKFDGEQIGSIYGTMALGTIFASLFAGQIADRYFSSQRLMGVLHLIGAGLLCGMAESKSFSGFFVVALVYALVYSPTCILSNSIIFTHVPDGGRDFPRIRVFGTIGWIAANLVVGQVLWRFMSHPAAAEGAAAIAGVAPRIDVAATNAPLLFAAAISVFLGLFSFTLPHTPPAGTSRDLFPAGRAIGLMRSRTVAIFFAVSFVVAILQAFYFGFASIYLEQWTLGVQLRDVAKEIPLNLGSHRTSIALNVASVMTIGQMAEMLLLPCLPWFLRKWGMKWVLIAGMIGWTLRFLIFALAARAWDPAVESAVGWGVIASLALHGICFDFFFAAGFVYVDRVAPKEIRASGQALFTFLAYGVGMWLGNLFSGYVVQHYTSGSDASRVYDWYHIWLVPCIGVLTSLAVFGIFFRADRKPEVALQGKSSL